MQRRSPNPVSVYTAKEGAMPRVVHFEIPADDPDRAIRFYQEVFGWTVKKWEAPIDYWLVTTGPEGEPGIDGAIARRTDVPVTCNTIDVPSVDDFIAKILKAGGQVKMEKTAVPGVGWFANCVDTEGNLFSIMQEAPNAK